MPRKPDRLEPWLIAALILVILVQAILLIGPYLAKPGAP